MKPPTILPPDVDAECRALCEAMNLCPGIHTIESCCGHGETPYSIFFVTERLSYLPFLLWHFDVCHCGFSGWRVEAYTDCAMCPVRFYLEGPIGPVAFEQSEKIAALILSSLKGNV